MARELLKRLDGSELTDKDFGIRGGGGKGSIVAPINREDWGVMEIKLLAGLTRTSIPDNRSLVHTPREKQVRQLVPF
jgi:hypothetical protein